jgi:hypothetical protein
VMALWDLGGLWEQGKFHGAEITKEIHEVG